MSVEVRNLQTGETFEVGPDGATFGREGGPANIKVADQSVSKRHARIFTDGTDWFLEDMGSVNGTVVDGDKIGAALPLRGGIVFQMSKFRFEVVTVDGRGPQGAPPDQETRTSLGGRPPNGSPLPSDLRKDPSPRKRAPIRDISPPQPPQFDQTNQGRNNNLPLASDQDFPSQSLNSASQQSLPDVDAPRPMMGIDQYDEDISPMAALAQGIGYVMKTAPMLVLNPLGTVRRQIESPPINGLEKIPLAAFLFPTLAIASLATTWVGVIATLIGGGGLAVVTFILGPVIAIVGGGIGAAITGFVGHPIFSWIVNKLGGTSDARSRTTHIAMGLATSLVLAAPTMLVTLLTAVAARLSTISSVFQLINIIPALIMIIAIPLPLFVQWSWWRSYNVAKWFQTLLLVLAGLSVLGGLAVAVTTVLGSVRAMRGTGVPAIAIGTPPVPSVDAGVVAIANPDDPPKEPVGKDPVDPVKEPVVKDPVDPVVKDPVVKDPVVKPPAAAGSGDYADFQRKRAAIDEALARDPSLVLKPGLKDLFRQLSIDTYNAEVEAEVEVLGKRRQRDGAQRLYLEKVKAARVYEGTRVTVNKLFKQLP